MPEILLATLNARYSHASLGLRCLRANLGELRERSELREYTIKRAAVEIVEDLLAAQPRILGFGVYIWNVAETERVLAMLRVLAPEVVIVLGGPEVSHEASAQTICELADYVVAGPGEKVFARLCRGLLAGARPDTKFIVAEAMPLDDVNLPYDEYSATDIAERVIYVEAARGCPFKCEFCLSALDKTTKPFPLDRFLQAMEGLHRRGARRFKFVDRTFNLNIQAAQRILAFFLERIDPGLFLHFEMIPDHLPEALKATIMRFPRGCLQFEVGVQSFNEAVQMRISRRQDNALSEANLRWLMTSSPVHVHADLIVGLPGEDMASFGAGFDRLVALGVQEIQVGMLKRLRGAPIARHAAAHGMCFNPLPPYEVLATDVIDFACMRRLARFARYWDIFGNSGRFPATLKVLLGGAPFERFLAFSDWLYGRTGVTHELARDRVWLLLYEYLRDAGDAARSALASDIAASGLQGLPRFLKA